ncbi:reverse transcriptase domain-containing protein [Tanacetum coccineum]
MDVLGPLPEVSGKVKFITVVVDYFTKWIEAKPLAKTTGKEVKKFVWDNIICRFGLPKIIVTDNGTNFIHDPFKSWNQDSAKLGVGRKISILILFLGRERKGWVDELPNVLWAHRTSLKTSNRETPYNLTFGSKAVIPVEIGMPTHRTMMVKEGEGNDKEIRVHPMSFKVGEYVYRKNEASRVENLGKLGPKREGPYLVVEAYQNGSYKLQTMDDREGVLAEVEHSKPGFELQGAKMVETVRFRGIHFLNFFNDPRIIREQRIAAYKGYRGGGHMGDDVESLGTVLERLWCKVEVDGGGFGSCGVHG